MIEEGPNKKCTMTRQGRALVLALQTGLVKQEEDGSADTTAFNRFWRRVPVREGDRVAHSVRRQTK